MKRTMALTAAATLFVTGTALPARAGVMRDCIQMERSCLDMDEVGENTEVYVGQQPNGSLRGFTDFAGFADWVDDTYDVKLTLRGGEIRMDLSGDGGDSGDRGDGDDGDRGGDDGDRGDHGDRGDRDRHRDRDRDRGNRHRGGDDTRLWSARKADFATFYESGDLSGKGLVVAPSEQIDDLRDKRRAGGGDWNNRISSVRVRGGNTGSPGAVLCSRASCQQGGWVLILNNGDESELTGGFNNAASFIGVFA